MSSLALMRWLESAPQRYDAGMRLLTLGRVGWLRQTAARSAVPAAGADVLEIGCGTGALTALLAARGAHVVAIDESPEMLQLARARLGPDGDAVEIREQTAAEIDRLPAASFDAVVAGFSLSEMSGAARAFVLRQATRLLRPHGVVVVADEMRPRATWRRAVVALLRLPQAALGWLIAGSTSRPLADAEAELRAAGLEIAADRRCLLDSFGVVVGRRKTAGRDAPGHREEP